MTETGEQRPENGQANKVSYKTCSALTASGTPCAAPAREGRAFCLFHDPAADSRELIALARSRGGKASMARLDPVNVRVDFSTAEATIGTVERLAVAMLEGTCDRGRASAVASLASVVLRARAGWELEERLIAVEAAIAGRNK